MRRRNREETEARMVEAFGRVLEREGIQKIGVNKVVREAGVGKELIYRYFNGLAGLAKAWGETEKFWPTIDELAGGRTVEAFRQLPPQIRLQTIFENYIAAIRKRPVTQEVLAAEIMQSNPLIKALGTVREKRRLEVNVLFDDTTDEGRETRIAVAMLLVAATNYLLIQAARKEPFYQFDLQSDEAWDAFQSGIRLVTEKIWAGTEEKN